MNNQVKEMFHRAELRYFSELEERQLLGYASGLLQRLDLLDSVEQMEDTILDDVVGELKKRYPKMLEDHGETAYEKARRDLGLTLRYAGLSMLARDPDFIHDKLAIWLRTIIFALVPDRDRATTAWELLCEASARHLSEDVSKELLPYLEIVAKELRGTLKAQAEKQEAA